ncbi:hypothetical protein JTB14_016692 [Gonioctena quinquepunctata]|nr:hypothetical protein JTB14_016692 [Gonioctena quinquepunctata]
MKSKKKLNLRYNCFTNEKSIRESLLQCLSSLSNTVSVYQTSRMKIIIGLLLVATALAYPLAEDEKAPISDRLPEVVEEKKEIRSIES